MFFKKHLKYFKFIKKIYLKVENLIFIIISSIIPSKLKYYFLKNKIYVKKKWY